MHAEREAEPGAIRQILLVLVLVGAGGLAAELFLLEHTESAWQWLPLGALAAALATGAAMAVRPTRGTVRAFQAVMAVTVAVGVLGVYLHYRGNAEFELETDPAVLGLELFWRSLHGATPALSPAAMAHLGLLGLASTYRHPRLARTDR